MVQDYQLNEMGSPTSPTGDLYKRAEMGGAGSIYSGDHRRRNQKGGAPSYTHSLHWIWKHFLIRQKQILCNYIHISLNTQVDPITLSETVI